MTKLAAVLLIAMFGGYGLYALAQVRGLDTRQAVTPIGTSSSNGVSFAWFYELNERTVYVCRTGADAVECKARAILP